MADLPAPVSGCTVTFDPEAGGASVAASALIREQHDSTLCRASDPGRGGGVGGGARCI